MHHDAETLKIVGAFERCTLPDLSHENHVRVTWYYATRDDLATMLLGLPGKLRRYAASKGASDVYHETITFAFACLIHERVSRRPADSWSAFAAANRDLFDSSLLGRYYTKDVLESREARRIFLLPRGRLAFIRDQAGSAARRAGR